MNIEREILACPAAKAHPRSKAKPAVLIVAVIVLAGSIAQVVLQRTGIIGDGTSPYGITIERASFFFGIVTASVLIWMFLFIRSMRNIFSLGSGFSLIAMLALAAVVALSTLIPAGMPAPASLLTDPVHSFAFAGICGGIGAGMIAAVWQVRQTLHQPRNLLISLVHLGSAVMLAGAGLTSAGSVHGSFSLNEGNTADQFQYNYRNIPQSNNLPLPAPLHLEKFSVTYHPVQYNLRVYKMKDKNFEEVQSIAARAKEVLNINDNTRIEVSSFNEVHTDTSTFANVVIDLHVKDTVFRDIRLTSENPFPLPVSKDMVMVFEASAPQPKSFESIISINGDAAKHHVKVNQPLVMGDYKIYQADFRRDDPTYSGFLVTYDPGRKVVKGGFLMIAAGGLGLVLFNLLSNKKRAA